MCRLGCTCVGGVLYLILLIPILFLPSSVGLLLFLHDDDVLVGLGIGLHVLDVHVCGLHDVPQACPGLQHLHEVPQQGHKDVPVLWVVQDVPLHHLGALPHGLVLRGKHLLYAQQELLVGLHGKVQSGEEDGNRLWAGGGGWEQIVGGGRRMGTDCGRGKEDGNRLWAGEEDGNRLWAGEEDGNGVWVGEEDETDCGREEEDGNRLWVGEEGVEGEEVFCAEQKNDIW